MLRVLLIPLPGTVLPDWKCQRVLFVHAREPREGLELLARDSWDAAVVVSNPTGEGAEALCGRIENTCELDALPLILAAEGEGFQGHESLAFAPFDAFLDLRWDSELAEQCLFLAVGRVRSGRGVAAIQQEILTAVGKELGALKDLCVRDELTGLYNFRYFREVLAREHQRCSRHQRTYVIVCFDLDNLRELNNTWGHAVGSRALARMGLALTRTTRRSDYAFRIGGDEFVSLLVESNPEGALLYAERVAEALQLCTVAEGEAGQAISVSAGLACFPRDGLTVDEVLNRADEALYRAKQAGRSRVVRYGEVA